MYRRSTRSVSGDTTINVAVELADAVGAEALRAQFAELAGVARVEPMAAESGLRDKLFLDREPAAVVAPLAALVSAADGHIVDLAFGGTTLEDVFISMTGRGLR